MLQIKNLYQVTQVSKCNWLDMDLCRFRAKTSILRVESGAISMQVVCNHEYYLNICEIVDLRIRLINFGIIMKMGNDIHVSILKDIRPIKNMTYRQEY